MKNNFKRDKNTVHYVAETAMGYHYGLSRYIRNSMAMSILGSELMMFFTGRELKPVGTGILLGAIGVFGASFLKRSNDRKLIDDDCGKFDDIYRLINRDVESEDILKVVFDKKTNSALIEFDDNESITESYNDNKYSCLYTNKKLDIVDKDITEEAVKVLRR